MKVVQTFCAAGSLRLAILGELASTFLSGGRYSSGSVPRLTHAEVNMDEIGEYLLG